MLCACSFSLYSCINLPRKFRACCKLKMGSASGWGSKVAVWYCNWDWDLPSPSPSPSSSPTTHANNISMLLFQIPMGAGTLPLPFPNSFPLGTHTSASIASRGCLGFPCGFDVARLCVGDLRCRRRRRRRRRRLKPPERAAAHASICRGSRKPQKPN